MTFSIVARCPRTGQFAVAVSSSSPSVAARCAYARAGVGAVTTQNVTDPRLGPRVLDLMEKGASAEEALKIVSRNCEYPEYRQLSAVDKSGNTAVFSGNETLGTNGSFKSTNAASSGNLLSKADIPNVIVSAFEMSSSSEELGSRVLAAMKAGLEAGGEAGPVYSAGLIVVDKEAWPLADIRVDWDESPVERTETIWNIWKPQMHDYVTRCLNPTDAPSYGVPGDQ